MDQTKLVLKNGTPCVTQKYKSRFETILFVGHWCVHKQKAHAKMSLLLFTFIHIKELLGLTMAFSFGCQKLNAPDLSP